MPCSALPISSVRLLLLCYDNHRSYFSTALSSSSLISPLLSSSFSGHLEFVEAMELFKELFVSVSVALLLSFLVAKLVSVAMAGDGGRDQGSQSGTEEVNLGDRLRVHGIASDRKVEFVGEDVKKVDEFEGGGSVQVDENLETSRGGEEFEDKRRELPEVLVKEGVGEESEVVELPEASLEGKSDEEEGVVERVVESDPEGVNEGKLHCLIEEDIENKQAEGIDAELETAGDVVVAQSDEARVVRCEAEGGDEEREGLGVDEDDWEGIERSELEQEFAAAAAYVGSEGKDGRLSSIGSDVQMQFYGLQKVAMEGPCREPQPIALKMSARANWNAWQRLGNMSPEMAMEQYIALLSDKVPGWMEDNSAEDNKLDTLEAGIPRTPDPDKPDTLEAGIPSIPDPDSSTLLHHQPNFTNERKPELQFVTEGGDPTGGSNSVNTDKE
ncbi:hypothetical protein L1049_025522 [Liquidambar formosana]|uniref:ACB domain-containing protein n=1 Tax=Liquidambar formosana TaxID=63359 RepID=A0AAP0NES0_LIQFO